MLIKAAITKAMITKATLNNMSMNLQYALVDDMSWQTQAEWQTPDTPFMSFAFWQALIDTGAIGEAAGWLPLFILVLRDDKSEIEDKSAQNKTQPIAVMPVFIKGHHQGEFVFDYAWAEAYARYGLDYYPRLVTSVPFTPITGARLWLATGEVLTSDIITVALAGVDDIAKQVGASGWHGLFVSADMATMASRAFPVSESINKPLNQHTASSAEHDNGFNNPILERQGCQFLWQNKDLLNDSQPFADFEAFLMSLTAKKRKNIRAERRKVAAQGITCTRKCAQAITDADWQSFYQCYVMTYAVRGQQPYLSLDFFMALAASMPEHLMLAQAYDAQHTVIASSLFLYDTPDNGVHKDNKNTTLYGRYWGALGEYDSLHFELCYYQGLEFAIEHGLTSFDPGTQGEHKLIRGFIPTTTHSLHRIYDARFVPAIHNFCVQERLQMAEYRQHAHAALPFNADNMPVFADATHK